VIFLDREEGTVLFLLLWKGTFLFVEICTSFYSLFEKTCVSDQLGQVLLFYPSKLDILKKRTIRRAPLLLSEIKKS